MKINSFLFVVMTIILPFTSGSAQSDILPIQEWQSYLPYKSAISVADAPDRTYFATFLSLYEVSKDFNSVHRHNKITGLSDMGVSRISYNRAYDLLIIAYNNGNIDVLNAEDGVTNYAAILDNNNITGSKNINHIFCDSNLVYLSCDFGLAVLDLVQEEFVQTTFVPQHIAYACTRLGDTLFLSTNKGIYKGNKQFNLLDFGNWQKQTSDNGMPVSTYESNAIITIQNKIFADVNDTVMLYNGGVWQHLACAEEVTGVVRDKFFTPNHANLLFKTDYNKTGLYIVYGATKDMTTRYNLQNNTYFNDVLYDFGFNDLEVDECGDWWGATGKRGGYRFRKCPGPDAGFWNTLSPQGPKDESLSAMAVDKDGALWITGTTFGSAFFDYRGTYLYKDNNWTYYDQAKIPAMSDFPDQMCIALHPETQEPYIGSFQQGLMHIAADDTATIYDASNSTLDGAVGNLSTTRVLGLAFDSDKNLWVANNLAVRPLSVMLADGTWKSFALPGSYSTSLAHITIDNHGYKWIVQYNGNAIVFDEGDMATDGDEQYYQLTTANELPSDAVNCIAADRESGVWVGCRGGITIFNCSQNMFTDGCLGSRPVINPDNFNGHLLESENVRTIAVDGGNRKWIGTDNGVFLLSPDGYEQISYFNVDNSPLFSNSIIKITIDPNTGEVFIATEKGLQSFRGEATAAELTMGRKAANVFPNPVRPDYQGLIAVDNLTEDANVKITDVSGRLVYQTQALGGQVTWDGADYNGRRARSGVYLVFAVSDDGKQRLVSKLVFLP